MPPVDLPRRKKDEMPSGPIVTVDRGDGHRFRMKQRTAQKFLQEHRGAFIVGQKAAAPAASQVPEPEATQESQLITQPSGPPDLDAMTRADLDYHAQTLGLDPSGAKNKADVIALIRGGGC